MCFDCIVTIFELDQVSKHKHDTPHQCIVNIRQFEYGEIVIGVRELNIPIGVDIDRLLPVLNDFNQALEKHFTGQPSKSVDTVWYKGTYEDLQSHFGSLTHIAAITPVW